MSPKPTKDKILLLRYSDFHGVNTIEEHIKVVKKKGACWWAKLGKTPSPKYISKYLENKSRIAFLYTAGSLHKCHVLDISDKRPEDSYPAYYDRDIFTNDEDVPSVFSNYRI